MNIRKEKHTDIKEISTVIYQAFEGHPHHESGAKPTEHLIVERLRNNGGLSLSLVCEDDTCIIGHIAFSKVLINDQDMSWYGLGPVSSLPERQGEGVGSALIKTGLAELKKIGAKGVVLLGEPDFYNRFGFKQRKELVLEGVPAEYFLALSFNDEYPTGLVTYNSAFFE